MISNDDELRITRERLLQAESILASYRRDFLPHNEVQYRLFSGTTVDLIRSMRADIEAYLGIGMDTDLTITLEGEDVWLGLPATAITRPLDTFRRSLQVIVGLLHVEAGSNGVSRSPGWLDRFCDLSLTGTMMTRSVHLFLDLWSGGRERPDERDLRFLSDALTTLFDGLEWAAREEECLPSSLERLSPATRLSVLGVVARLFPPQTGPVERIDYRRRSEGLAKPRRRATLTRQARQRVHREMERLAADRKFTEAEGVIRQIDLDAQTFILRERPDNQADLPCEYPKTLAEMAKELLDCRVLVSGLLETSRLTHRSKMEAEAIEPLGGDEERVDEPENAARTA